MRSMSSSLARGAARAAAVAVVLALAGPIGAAGAVAPPPCGGNPQITDPIGDGHHDNTDIAAAWLSEQAGRLQAVVRLRQGIWEPAHDDSEAAGFALLFELGGQTRYVRAEAPRNAPVRYDYGTWTQAGGFVSAGATTGEALAGYRGTVTIDIPAALGIAPGMVLARPFALTYDGITANTPHWVDAAPGGTGPLSVQYGADYVVGSCTPTGPGNPPGGQITTTAVSLKAPKRLVGGGSARVTGSVLPARGGVPVEISIRRAGRTATRQLTTAADGSYSTRLKVGESSRLRALAEGIGSQEQAIVVVSKVQIKLRRLRGGAVLVRGRVWPALPGRVRLLRRGEYTPTAKTTAREGRFRLRLSDPSPGRYRAEFIPARARAERSISNKGVIK